ncbi:MAG: PH domain-containing protein [Longimicrobiales bacterium]
MPEGLKGLVLRWLRVPEDPEPPAGDPSSLRVFRAAPEYFRYRRVGWIIGQLGTLIGLTAGLVVGLSFLGDWTGRSIVGGILTGFAVLAWLGLLAQIPFSYAALRLDYELRWYMLSDRALRIREGIIGVREMTMTFANIQQIAVKQGPIQRLLGIADVEVRTAGGGSSTEEGGDDMHKGYFRGVADAESIRDTIRERVREYRDAGLGGEDPGAASRAPGRVPAGATAADRPRDDGVVQAAHEVLAEVRALRATL